MARAPLALQQLRCQPEHPRLVEMPAIDRIPLVSIALGRPFRAHDGPKHQGTLRQQPVGLRLSTSVGGPATGESGDRIVCDDPHHVQEAESDTSRKSTVEWWDIVMSTRVNDPRTAAKSVVMQRCHQQVLSGHLLEQGGWDCR